VARGLKLLHTKHIIHADLVSTVLVCHRGITVMMSAEGCCAAPCGDPVRCCCTPNTPYTVTR
jgi:hypothetical protein